MRAFEPTLSRQRHPPLLRASFSSPSAIASGRPQPRTLSARVSRPIWPSRNCRGREIAGAENCRGTDRSCAKTLAPEQDVIRPGAVTGPVVRLRNGRRRHASRSEAKRGAARCSPRSWLLQAY